MHEVPKAKREHEAEAQSIQVDFAGTRIRQIREHVGRSIQEVAQAGGMAPDVLQAIEGGAREPTLRELTRIATGCGVSVRQILGPLSPAAIACGIAFDELSEELKQAVLVLLREPGRKA